MATTLAYTKSGAVIRLGNKLGTGGEGSVYEIAGNSRQVAKIYHRIPDAGRQAKLRYMADSSNAQLLRYASWPQETLHETTNGSVIGFLMPLVRNHVPMHILYGPAHRRQEFPKVAFDFLVLAARNTAAAFSTLHAQGHIVGDINQSNVLVARDARVTMIDCDSFQIHASGITYPCEVGVSHFTPPELQGLVSFADRKRTTAHDNFGLALVVFHLLFGGRHPYSGVPLGKTAGENLEADIQAFRFAYARDARLRGLEPPPNSIPFSIVPEAIRSMFEAAFTERGASGGRPSADEWVSALDALRKTLRKCGSTPMHVFPAHRNRCPWCALDDRGLVFFVDTEATIAPSVTGFDLDQAWARIEAIPPPVAPAIPQLSPASTPTPTVHARREIAFRSTVVIIAVIGLLTAVPKLWLLTTLGCLSIGVWAIRIRWGHRASERRLRANALLSARRVYETLAARLRAEAGPQRFRNRMHELAALRDEYRTLRASGLDAATNMQATAELRQKQHFLQRCHIDKAVISGVGPAKRSALASFGIETAADVTSERVRAVRGFGDHLTKSVVDWRRSCERRFVFVPHKVLRESDAQEFRARIHARRRALETALAAGATELQRIRDEAEASARTLTSQIHATARKLAQIQIEASRPNMSPG